MDYDNDVTMRDKGFAYEKLACQFLRSQGLELIVQNYQSRFGEIDLIMQDKNSLVFIEVRYRKKWNYGSGAESITFYKKNKIIKTAYHFLKVKKLFEKIPCRFDVMSVWYDEHNPKFEWIKNAFDAYN